MNLENEIVTIEDLDPSLCVVDRDVKCKDLKAIVDMIVCHMKCFRTQSFERFDCTHVVLPMDLMELFEADKDALQYMEQCIFYSDLCEEVVCVDYIEDMIVLFNPYILDEESGMESQLDIYEHLLMLFFDVKEEVKRLELRKSPDPEINDTVTVQVAVPHALTFNHRNQFIGYDGQYLFDQINAKLA